MAQITSETHVCPGEPPNGPFAPAQCPLEKENHLPNLLFWVPKQSGLVSGGKYIALDLSLSNKLVIEKVFFCDFCLAKITGFSMGKKSRNPRFC